VETVACDRPSLNASAYPEKPSTTPVVVNLLPICAGKLYMEDGKIIEIEAKFSEQPEGYASHVLLPMRRIMGNNVAFNSPVN
jgi:hypothetical protein